MRRLALTTLVAFGLLALAPTSALGHEGATPPPIVAFSDWSGGACPVTPLPVAFTIQRLVVHHTSEPVATTEDAVPAVLREICAIHLARGFDTIGYHYIVDPWGTVWQARGALPDASGMAPAMQLEGAHVAGTNPGSVGVAFLGDHELAPPTAEAVEAATQLLTWLADATHADPADSVTVESTGVGTALAEGLIQTHVLDGHNDTNATLCPGRHLDALMGPIRDEVRRRMAANAAGSTAALGSVDESTGGADGQPFSGDDGGSFTSSLGLRAVDEVLPAPDVATGATLLASDGPILAAPAPAATPASTPRVVAMLALLLLVRLGWKLDPVAASR